MKYREFIEDPLYSKDLPEWIDMIFGKKQQRKESKNIFFSFATPEYFNNTSTEEILKTEALMSATEFYQLPRKLFMNKHRNITNKDPNDLREETEISNKIFGNESEMLKEEIRVRVNDTIICRNFSKEDPFERMTIIGGNLKDECNSFYLVWKINKVIPLISVHKNKKERDNSTTKEKLTFEIVDSKDKYLLPMNYVSQFTLKRKEFVVIGRLVTSQFAIVDTSSEPMECKYFGVDALTNTITAIHCSKDNKSIIAGYETGTIAIWEIKSSINQEESKEERKLGDQRLRVFHNRVDVKPYAINFKSLQSSANENGIEIVAIDANSDLGMFIAINKGFCVTVHSLQSGQCLNWIKFTYDKRIIQGIQLTT